MERNEPRELMSDSERKLLYANRELVEKNTSIEKDIRILISYLKGKKYLKSSVQEIINYYSNNLKRNKYDQ